MLKFVLAFVLVASTFSARVKPGQGIAKAKQHASIQNVLNEEGAKGKCKAWCLTHDNKWKMKCTFKNCLGCSQCGNPKTRSKGRCGSMQFRPDGKGGYYDISG